MRATLALAALSTLSVASAATIAGYGRFACSSVNGDGTQSALQSVCDGITDPTADSPGTGAGGSQGDNPAPVGSECVLETESGSYFCGIAGAACTSDAECDNGHCSGTTTGSTCQGGFTQSCSGDDSNCLGYLYCTDESGGTTAADTCGGLGAFCQDFTAGDSSLSDAENAAIFDQFCESGYCSYNLAVCATRVTVAGGSCADDPEFECGISAATGAQLVPSSTDSTCVCQEPTASARARSRRSGLHRRNLCPASHSACAVQGGKGFECIDVTSNIEQCGACAAQGGVDCTQIEGVSAVGCVAGTCEIWSCEDGYTYDAAKGSCVASLVL